MKLEAGFVSMFPLEMLLSEGLAIRFTLVYGLRVGLSVRLRVPGIYHRAGRDRRVDDGWTNGGNQVVKMIMTFQGCHAWF